MTSRLRWFVGGLSKKKQTNYSAISKVKNGSHQSCQFKFMNFLNCQQRSNSGDILHVLEFRKSLSVVESFHEDFGEFLLLFLRLVLKNSYHSNTGHAQIPDMLKFLQKFEKNKWAARLAERSKVSTS